MSGGTMRDLAYNASPSWWRGKWASRYLYSIAVQFDALMDLAAYAVRASFPTLAPPDNIANIANDRGIYQGFQESAAAYAVRLTQWLDRWAKGGSPWGVLMALRGYVAPATPACAIVNTQGQWSYYLEGAPSDPSDGPVTQLLPAWTWDSIPYAWWRIWIIIWPVASGLWSQYLPNWGASAGWTWGSGWVWGTTATTAQVVAMKALVQTWASANTVIPFLLMAWSTSWFSPFSSSGDLPTAAYQNYGTVTTTSGRRFYGPGRSTNAAYIAVESYAPMVPGRRAT